MRNGSAIGELQTSTHFGPAELTFRELFRVMGLAKRVMEPYFAESGISGPQFAVLWTLCRSGPEGLRLIDLGQQLLVRPPSVTGIVTRLIKLGLVFRLPASGDLRERRVTISEQGRELVASIRQTHPGQIRRLMGGLNDDEQTQLRTLLSKLAGHMATIAAEVSEIADKDEE